MERRSELVESIVGEKLSAITFMLDYWQLQFDGPTINVLTRLAVSANGLDLDDEHDQFKNVICGQIGKVVAGVTLVQPEAFTITFTDQSSIKISLRGQDYRGPEAMVFHGHNQSSVAVIRAEG
jgi:hypothetical protein